MTNLTQPFVITDNDLSNKGYYIFSNLFSDSEKELLYTIKPYYRDILNMCASNAPSDLIKEKIMESNSINELRDALSNFYILKRSFDSNNNIIWELFDAGSNSNFRDNHLSLIKSSEENYLALEGNDNDLENSNFLNQDEGFKPMVGDPFPNSTVQSNNEEYLDLELEDDSQDFSDNLSNRLGDFYSLVDDQEIDNFSLENFDENDQNNLYTNNEQDMDDRDPILNNNSNYTSFVTLETYNPSDNNFENNQQKSDILPNGVIDLGPYNPSDNNTDSSAYSMSNLNDLSEYDFDLPFPNNDIDSNLFSEEIINKKIYMPEDFTFNVKNSVQEKKPSFREKNSNVALYMPEDFK